MQQSEFVDLSHVILAEPVEPKRKPVTLYTAVIILALGSFLVFVAFVVTAGKRAAEQIRLDQQRKELTRLDANIARMEAQEKAAEQRAAQERQEATEALALRDRFTPLLAAVHPNGVYLKSVSVRIHDGPRTATITVTPAWHREVYQNRLQLAQSLQQTWANN
jgi:Tfp pilus assembly protein PilN